MKKQLTIMSISLVLLMSLCACSSTQMSSSADNSSMDADSKKDITTDYKKITAEEAKGMMSKDTILLDVRTADEFEEAHIPGAILLTHTEIEDRAQMLLPDKDQSILVYCRSGNRSEIAAKELISMGYKNVYDFGGIQSWTGETVSGKDVPA